MQIPNRLWSFITAVVLEAHIIFHKLEGKQGVNMRGMPKATYQTCDRGLLNGAGNDASDAELKWITKLRNAAVDHTVQGSRPIIVPRRMEAIARQRGEIAKVAANTFTA